MSNWQSNGINNINTGAKPNDGSGDSIYAAFTKVDSNFANISNYLQGTSGSTDFINSNVTTKFNAQTWGNINNANITTLYGSSANNGNVILAAAIIPNADGTYDLGSPTRQFGTIYYKNQVQSGQTTTVDAGLLKIHANAFPGDIQDTGIFGNITSDYNNALTFAFFGHQYTTNNFVYKITNTDSTAGNNIVAGGFYGNVQFGSAFLSNTSTTGNTLIVAGDTRLVGNTFMSSPLYTTANIYSGGNLVITTGLINTFGTPTYAGGVIIGSQYFTGNVNTTGSINVNPGNVNVNGNIVGGLVGPYYGTIQTVSQPNITTVGSLGNLTVINTTTTNTLNATSISATNITAVGNVYVSSIIGLTSLGITGNLTAGAVVGPQYGLVMTPAQPNITSVGTLGSLAVTGNITGSNLTVTQVNANQVNANLQGTLLTASQPNITTVGTLGSLTVTNGITGSTLTGTLQTAAQTNVTSLGILTGLTVSGNTIVNSTLYARGVFDNSNRVVSTSSGAGNLTISGTGINLTAIGPGAITAGTATAIPVITTDAYGRITALTTSSITTTLSTSAGTGTGSVIFASQALNIAGGTDITTTASAQSVTINGTSTLATVTGRGASTSTAVTFNGQVNVGASIVPTASNTYTVGSSTSWFSGVYARNFYGTSTTAQYADLAEKYLADQEYPIGTVVAVGGDAEVTASQFGDLAIGVVSDKPAYMMNSELEGGTYIALKGRVPVSVVGAIRKGQRLIATNNGCAVAGVPASNNVFAVALETSDNIDVKLIEAVIL